MSYYPGNQNRKYRSSPPSNNGHSRRYQGYNPFLDNPEQNKRHEATIKECERVRQESDARRRRQDAAVTKLAMQNNPYLNDVNLINSMQNFGLGENKRFENQHSVRSASKTTAEPQHSHHNGHHSQPDKIETQTNAEMGPDIISPQNLSNWMDDDANPTNERKTQYVQHVQNNGSNYHNHFAKAQQNEEDKIKINADNPYHPTNFYKDKDTEQLTAVSLVNQFRVTPKDVIKADEVEHEYEEFMHSLQHTTQSAHHNGYNDRSNFNKHVYNNTYSPRKQNIGVDDMIPGQEMITPHNFQTLHKEDTVWIRNDDGDWEIFSVSDIEKTSCYNQEKRCYAETYVGTFKNQNREQTIWQEQTMEEFRMARYIKEKEVAIIEDMYAINNIFKIKMDGVNGHFVLKGYDNSNNMADLVCVKTGDRLKINLSEVEHSIIGN